MDYDFRRLKYVRYADDFLCAVIGTKDEAKVIKQDIKRFLEEKLSLELSEDKTLITHGKKSAKFLGYEIYVRKSAQTKRNKAGKLTRPYNNKIYLKMPTEVVRKKLLDYDALQIKVHNGKERYKPKHRTEVFTIFIHLQTTAIHSILSSTLWNTVCIRLLQPNIKVRL